MERSDPGFPANFENAEAVRVGGVNTTRRAIDSARPVDSANDTAPDANVGSASGKRATVVQSLGASRPEISDRVDGRFTGEPANVTAKA